MQSSLVVDAVELRNCAAHAYGKKFKSYRKGYLAGKVDAKKNQSTRPPDRGENPYTLSPEVVELLRKRARWEMGYQMGWAVVHGNQIRRHPPSTKLKKRKVLK